jgi:ketosteroid isomerase-like protein
MEESSVYRSTTRTAALFAPALLATACLAAPKSPGPAATAQARKEIQAAYSRQDAAVAAKDVDGFVAIETPDAVDFDTDGTTETVAQGRQMMAQVMAAMKHCEASSVITGISLTDARSAVVTIKEHMVMVGAPPGKATSTMVSEGTSRDNWVKTASGWRLKASHALTDRMTVDGKPVKR